MEISVISITLLVSLALPADPPLQAGMPMMKSVDPASGKAGDVLAIQGNDLGPENVAALYLTDEKTDVKVVIVEQTATSITFRIPSEAKPGRFALMVLTGDKAPRLVEEPVKITIEPEAKTPTISSSEDEAIEYLLIDGCWEAGKLCLTV